MCILIVDDSKFFLELEKQFLRNTPATILTALSGEEALALAREHRPSLVYIDMDMPEMNGLDCCRMFKSDRELQRIPVVLVGQKDSASDESNAQAAGAAAYMAKPLDRRIFLGTGHRFLVSIDRRESRLTCQLVVNFICQGQHLQGRCVDVSSGGMFLACQPTTKKGDKLRLNFSLPDGRQTPVEISGRIAWANTSEEITKENYPLGYGVEFVEISDLVGIALRRCFGA